jgi:hypothetical protein
MTRDLWGWCAGLVLMGVGAVVATAINLLGLPHDNTVGAASLVLVVVLTAVVWALVYRTLP